MSKFLVVKLLWHRVCNQKDKIDSVIKIQMKTMLGKQPSGLEKTNMVQWKALKI